MRSIGRQIGQALQQVRQAFVGVVRRTGPAVQVAGLEGELLPEVQVWQQVGMVSGLPMDAQVVMLPLSGKTAKAVVIASRGGAVSVMVSEGQTCIYDQFGHQILLSESGVSIVGNVTVQGSLTATSVSDSRGSMQAMRDTFNGHGGHNTTPTGTPMDSGGM